jgi:hypothetical protein
VKVSVRVLKNRVQPVHNPAMTRTWDTHSPTQNSLDTDGVPGCVAGLGRSRVVHVDCCGSFRSTDHYGRVIPGGGEHLVAAGAGVPGDRFGPAANSQPTDQQADPAQFADLAEDPNEAFDLAFRGGTPTWKRWPGWHLFVVGAEHQRLSVDIGAIERA